MRRLLLTPLLLGIACTSSTPSSETPEELGTRADPVLTHDQIGNFTLPSTLPYRTVSFTFDDGPDVNWVDNGVTRNTSLMIAEYLNQQGIRATFFINGVRIGKSAYPANFLSQIVALGHRVANHTYDHDDLPSLSGTPAAQVAELHDNQVILDPYITDGMYLFRAPGDNWGQVPRADLHACDGSSAVADNLRGDPLLSKLAGPFCFDWDAHDWVCTSAEQNLTPEQCAAYYMYMGEDLYPDLPSRERGIIQMHDANPNASGTRWEYDFVVDLVTRLKAKSGTPYVFVPLDAIPGVRGTLSFPSPTDWTRGQLYLSDADNWQYDVGHYGTIRLGDIDGDGRADVCGRGGSGIRCALSNGDGTMKPEHLWLGIVSDADGYLPEQYSTTFQLADIDGDGRADACMRGGDGYICFKSLAADPLDPLSPPLLDVRVAGRELLGRERLGRRRGALRLDSCRGCRWGRRPGCLREERQRGDRLQPLQPEPWWRWADLLRRGALEPGVHQRELVTPPVRNHLRTGEAERRQQGGPLCPRAGGPVVRAVDGERLRDADALDPDGLR
ncbi:polysaccharide deacetylase family protein [Myxococcus stipitatus]|uniref:polysaccharide deacetylase family protein n=1 Tax=Myxococcus stipitatus TaxID=83455 RepID=UPI001F419245|nr:polysaccharide deacetylase family protein [Myxococcus stipitatus]MCE9673403.1 polysaccharide deacetylase family protein [Myxococcus stipitatus]